MRRLLIALTALVARCEEPQAPAAPPAPISLTIKDVGTLRVDPGVDPADVVEEFAAEARGAGVDVSVDDMRRMHSWFCSYAPCPRPLASTLTARVRGVEAVARLPARKVGRGDRRSTSASTRSIAGASCPPCGAARRA